MQWDERFLNELRALLPEYMAQKRIVVGTRGKKLIHCINPEHRDRTPSMSYHPQSRRLHCFGCGANYDLFDVIAMDYPDCDSFPRQVKKACELFDIPLPDNAPASKPGVRAGGAPDGRLYGHGPRGCRRARSRRELFHSARHPTRAVRAVQPLRSRRTRLDARFPGWEMYLLLRPRYQ